MAFICLSKKKSCIVQNSPDKNTPTNSVTLQIVATLIAALLHIPLIGFNFGYSAVLIAQLEECQIYNSTCNNVIYVTDTDKSWIASLITVFIPIGGIIVGFMLDSLGRLTVLRLSAVPGIIGWILLGTAVNVPMLLLGRVLNGFATSWAICSTFVYVSEISSPQIRGSMGTIPSTFGAIGIAISYALGYFFHWRIVAWIAMVVILLFTALTMVLPKSPVWLVSRERIDEAKLALDWLNRYHKQPEAETKNQLDALINLHNSKEHATSAMTCVQKLKMLLEPTVYKPIIILTFFNIFVQFSGLYIVIFYAVSLFNDIGTDINPFVASISFATARSIAAIGTIGLMQRYGRRELMITSGLLMGITVGISAMYTKWIVDGVSTYTWVPVVMIALYVIATMIGFLAIPLAIPSELFPTAVRGLGQSLSISISYSLVFASTRSYYYLKEALDGVYGLQFLFAAMSVGGAVYTYIFLPETHKKSLHEIEDYFKHNSVYLLYKLRTKKKHMFIKKRANRDV